MKLLSVFFSAPTTPAVDKRLVLTTAVPQHWPSLPPATISNWPSPWPSPCSVLIPEPHLPQSSARWWRCR